MRRWACHVSVPPLPTSSQLRLTILNEQKYSLVIHRSHHQLPPSIRMQIVNIIEGSYYYIHDNDRVPNITKLLRRSIDVHRNSTMMAIHIKTLHNGLEKLDAELLSKSVLLVNLLNSNKQITHLSHFWHYSQAWKKSDCEIIHNSSKNDDKTSFWFNCCRVN